jgi:hypothetical protein
MQGTAKGNRVWEPGLRGVFLKLSHGYARSRSVPVLGGTQSRVCGKCSLWFAARPRERVCDGCVPQKTRNARFAVDPNWGTKAGVKLPGAPGQGLSLGGVPDRIPVLAGRGKADRERSVSLALKQARLVAKDPGVAGHVPVLLTYARSVARGVVPGSVWQLTNLGYRIAPCTGVGNPFLLPRPEGPETLAEAESVS